MFQFLILKTDAFGLDISDLSLKLAKLKKKGKSFQLLSWGEQSLHSGIIENGEVKDEGLLTENIIKLLSKYSDRKIKNKNVIISLPEKKCFIKIIKMPKMTEKELESALLFEIENHIPFPLKEVYFDFQIIPSLQKDDFINLLVAAIPRKIADSYLSCAKKAGLSPLAFESESQSIPRALIKDNFSSFPVLIIDIGRSNTNFVIFSKNTPYFTASNSFSSNKITQAIFDKLGKSLEEAEKIKIEDGLQDEKIFEIIKPALATLTSQIEKYINYYENFSKGRVEKILLCGRGSNLKGLEKLIYFYTKIKTEKGNPWINILPHSKTGLSFEESLGYTTSFGLALRGMKEDKI